MACACQEPTRLIEGLAREDDDDQRQARHGEGHEHERAARDLMRVAVRYSTTLPAVARLMARMSRMIEARLIF